MSAKPETALKSNDLRKSLGISLEDAGRRVVNQLLTDDEPIQEEDEQAEIGSARAILSALQTLQASLPNPSPEQQHDLTTIRASANAIIRMHNVV